MTEIVCEECSHAAVWRVEGVYRNASRTKRTPAVARSFCRLVCTAHVGYAVDQMPYRTATVQGLEDESPLP